MDLQIDPALPTSFYKELLEDASKRTIEIERLINESEDIAAIKQWLFPRFVQAHREMVTAEARWYRSIVEEMRRNKIEPNKNPLLFWKK